MLFRYSTITLTPNNFCAPQRHKGIHSAFRNVILGMDTLVLTQWEYQDLEAVEEEASAEPSAKIDARQDLSGVFFTSDGYVQQASGYESSGEKRKALARAHRDEITDLNRLSPGRHNIICCLLDSQLATLKLQLVLVGDETNKPLRIKLCGQSFAKQARSGGAWRIGSILYIRHLQVSCLENGTLEGILKRGAREEEEETGVVVLKQVTAGMKELGAVDLAKMQQLCVPGEFCTDVVIPKSEKVFRWLRAEHKGLLRFVERQSVPMNLHFRSLAAVNHADVVTLAGVATRAKLSYFPSKAGMQERPYLVLRVQNGEEVVGR